MIFTLDVGPLASGQELLDYQTLILIECSELVRKISESPDMADLNQ